MREVIRRARGRGDQHPRPDSRRDGDRERATRTYAPSVECCGDRPFISVNCAAIPPALLESELFGHVKGAFTGAVGQRLGRFQMANGGTLLLDEIGELPTDLQVKLLRVLQEGSFEPVGSDRSVKVDARVLAATNVNLERAIQRKQFREDLYYRLSVFPLQLPPLRERLEDVPLICTVLLQDLGRRMGRHGYTLSREGIAKLTAYHWPGNLRELANVLERAIILARERRLGPEALDLPQHNNTNTIPSAESTTTAVIPSPTAVQTLETLERAHIRRVLALTNGRIYGKAGAADLLGLKPSTLQSRMKKLDIVSKEVTEQSGT
jgi:transcriptional regulator with GAF, ATPase, and Fis domain